MTRFLHSRYFVIVAALLAAACIILFYSMGQVPYPVADSGIVPAWGMERYGIGPWAMAVAIALNMGVAALLCYLNKAFNLLRCMTMLQGSLFLIMELATPSAMLFLAPGICIAFVFMLCVILLYANYGHGAHCQRSMFLAFAMLSAGAAVDYGFMAYVPVMWIGMAQMRIFNLRSVLASLLGLVTPWVIFLGLGIVPLSALDMPQVVSWAFPAISTALWLVLATALFTLFLAVISWAQNVMKIMTYNAQSRAMLGVPAVAFVFTVAAMIINPMHGAAFVPMLNICAAVQLAHVFGVMLRRPNSCWAILAIILIYLGIFAWRTALCVL